MGRHQVEQKSLCLESAANSPIRTMPPIIPLAATRATAIEPPIVYLPAKYFVDPIVATLEPLPCGKEGHVCSMFLLQKVKSSNLEK